MLEPVAEVSNGTNKEFEIDSSCISPLFWSNGTFTEADAKSEAVHLSLFPEYFPSENQLRALLQSDEIYSSLFDYPPLKPVSIGPEHQADVPEWNSSAHLDQADHDVGLKLSLDDGLADDRGERKLMGTCIISKPDPEASAKYCWVNRNDCECLDKGSIRCVRQHVMEAREKLRESLGQKLFEELGFCDMGEEVSVKWTEEEETKFHEVVSSNPASMGKNFWDHLSVVFPSRTKNDLFSYYFNVFILQKRAEQNRFDPLNIDSDDDEWQRSDLGAAEEDEDSGVESFSNLDVPAYYQEDHAENSEDESDGCNLVGDCKDGTNIVHTPASDGEDKGDVDDISEPHVRNHLCDSAGHNELQLLGNIQSSNQENYDFWDDSCMSYDYQQDKVNCCDALDTGKQSGQA